MLLAAGTPGKRLALPNSRILIHQPYTEGSYGQSSDIEIQANEILRMRELLEKLIADHTGKTPEEVNADIERDKILTVGGGGGVRPDRRRSSSRSRAPPPPSDGPARPGPESGRAGSEGVAVSCPIRGRDGVPSSSSRWQSSNQSVASRPRWSSSRVASGATGTES